MGMNLDAIVRINAQATGGQQLQGLADKISHVEGVTKRLTASSGILTSALGALAPIASIAGLGALIKGQIEAGDRMHDLSQQTGVSVEVLAKFDKAAKISGTTLDAVSKGILKLSKAMVAAASSTGMADSIKKDLDKAEYNIKSSERRQVDLIKDAADARLDVLERESDKALKEIGRRYKEMEKILNRQFEDEDDSAARNAEARLSEEQKYIERFYEQRKNAVRDDQSLSDSAKDEALQILQDRQDAEMDSLRNDYADKAKERRRQVQDEREKKLEAMQDQRSKEEAVIKDKNDAQQKLIKDAADNQINELKRITEAALTALKKNDEGDQMSQQLEELGLSGKGASKAFQELEIDIKNADGTMKSADAVLLEIADKFKFMPNDLRKSTLAMQLFGKSGYELIPMLNMGGDAIDKMKVAMTAAFAENADKYNDKLTILGGKVGGLARGLTVALLPALTQITDVITKAVEAFAKLPEPVQTAAAAFVIFNMALGALKFTGVLAGLGQLLGLLKGLGSLRIAATIAGWLGAFGPFVAGAQAALGGLMAWMTGTLLPTLVGVFSGPVGWIALAVAALVAAVIIWREPLMNFVKWLWDWGEPIRKFWVDLFGGIGMLAQKSFILVSEAAAFAFKLLGTILYSIFIQPWVNAWNNVLKPAATGFLTWLSEAWTKTFNAVMTWLDKNVTQPLGKIWNEYIRTPITNFFTWFSEGWNNNFNAVIAWLYENVIQPLGRIWDEYVRMPITNFFTWLSETWTGNFNAVITWLDENVIQPLGKIWDEKIRTPITDFFTWVSTTWNNGYKTIIDWLDENFVKKFNNVWTSLKKSPEDFTKDVKAFFFGLYDDIIKKYEEVQGFMSKLFKMSINYLVNGAIDKINGIVDLYNTIANTVNSKTNLGLPTLSKIAPRVDEEATTPIQKMATGAYVTRPTLTWVGEGSNPREYVIPEDGMDQAAMAWQAGVRGNDLVAAWQSPGLAPGRSTTTPAQSSGGGPVSISLTHTGDVFQLPSGENLVRIDQVPSIIEAAVKAVRRRS